MIASALPQSAVQLPAPVAQGLATYLANGKLRLPMLPTVVADIFQICEAPNSGARDIATILHRDPALAGHVLRVANSPLYRPRMPITSLQQATSRLGMAQITEIVYSVTLQNQAFQVAGYEHVVRTMWGHAVGTAWYTKAIARLQGYDADKAFLWGLLHDVGKPVILLALAQLPTELSKLLDNETVSAAMDLFHTQAGALLADRWGLPAMVKECIEHHHDPLAAVTCHEAALVTCVADTIAKAVLTGEPLEEVGSQLSQHPAVQHLGLSGAALEDLLAMSEEVQQMMATMAAIG